MNNQNQAQPIINVGEVSSDGNIQVSPQNYTDIYGAMSQNLQNAVQAQVANIGLAAANKGAMLAPNSPIAGISAYDYNRYVAAPLKQAQADLDLAGAQYSFQQAMKNMMADAQSRYNAAREAKNARDYASYIASGGGGRGRSGSGGSSGTSGGNAGSGGGRVTGVETNAVKGKNYGLTGSPGDYGDWVGYSPGGDAIYVDEYGNAVSVPTNTAGGEVVVDRPNNGNWNVHSTETGRWPNLDSVPQDIKNKFGI